jgi:hypothetical protein
MDFAANWYFAQNYMPRTLPCQTQTASRTGFSLFDFELCQNREIQIQTLIQTLIQTQTG